MSNAPWRLSTRCIREICTSARWALQPCCARARAPRRFCRGLDEFAFSACSSPSGVPAVRGFAGQQEAAPGAPGQDQCPWRIHHHIVAGHFISDRESAGAPTAVTRGAVVSTARLLVLFSADECLRRRRDCPVSRGLFITVLWDAAFAWSLLMPAMGANGRGRQQRWRWVRARRSGEPLRVGGRTSTSHTLAGCFGSATEVGLYGDSRFPGRDACDSPRRAREASQPGTVATRA